MERVGGSVRRGCQPTGGDVWGRNREKLGKDVRRISGGEGQRIGSLSTDPGYVGLKGRLACWKTVRTQDLRLKYLM